MSLLATAHAEGGASRELLVPCQHKEQNERRVEQASTEHAAQGCKDQVKKSMEACGAGPAESAEEVELMASLRGGGANRAADGQQRAYTLGRDRYLGHSQVCEQELDKVDQRCKEMVDGLKQALRNNSQERDQVQSQLSSTPANDPNRSSLVQRLREHQQISLDLQRDMNATQSLRSAAASALRDASQCDVNQARIYADAADQTGLSVASSSAEGPHGTNDPHSEPADGHGGESGHGEGGGHAGGHDPLGHVLKDKAMETTYAQTTERVGETVAHRTGSKALSLAGKAGGGIFPVMSAMNNDAVGTATGAAQTAADLFATPATALRVTGVGTFLSVFLASSPAGQCSEIYTNPVSAYSQGCSVTTIPGSHANEMAIQSLSAP